MATDKSWGGGCRLGEAGDRGGGHIAASRILDRHRDSERHAQIAKAAGTREPAQLGDLEVDRVHGAAGMRSQKRWHRIDHFVEHERAVRPPTDGQALLVARAGLLENEIKFAHSAHQPRGLVRRPAAVRIANQQLTRLERAGQGADSRDVVVRVLAPTLAWKVRKPWARAFFTCATIFRGASRETG